MRFLVAAALALLLAAAGPAGADDGLDEYYSRLWAVKPDKPEESMALAVWCLDAHLPGKARECLEKVLTLSSDHPKARELLGHQKPDKTWLAPAEVPEWTRSADRFDGLQPLHAAEGTAIACGALQLDCDLASMQEAFDASDWETITDLAVYRDRLYLGACNNPVNHKSGDVIEYDAGTGKHRKVYTVNEQGILRLHVFQDKLWIPGPDEEFNNADASYIYVFDGKKWTLLTVPGFNHLFDCGLYKGQLYACGQQRRNSSGDRTSRGKVLLSKDGKAWTLSCTTEIPKDNAWSRMWFARVFQDKLAVNLFTPTRGEFPEELRVFDGKTWEPQDFSAGGATIYGFVEHRGRLYLSGMFGAEGSAPYRVFSWDGRAFEPVEGLADRNIRGLASDGVRLVALGKDEQGPVLYESVEGKEWTEAGRLPGREFKPVWTPPLLFYRGRLHVGSTATAKVFAAPYRKEGSLSLLPRKFPQAKTLSAKIKGEIPKGTSVRLFAKTAAAREGIEAAASREIGTWTPGTDLRIPMDPERPWLQIELRLATSSPDLTPRVSSLNLEP